MRVLIAGANGQLGRELLATCPEDVQPAALDKTQLDITQKEGVHRVLHELRPDLIVNAAAYTAVDLAEEERELAFAVNAEGPRHLAEQAHEIGARLLHISTDFVFAGNQSRPYPSDAETDPQSAYGASKLAGENHILQISGARGLIVRTAWVYSRFGTNFVKTMLRLMSEREELSVVVDQIGSPTWARGLACLIWSCREHAELHGIYHWTDAGVASWYDLAVAIQEEALALRLLGSLCQVLPVTTADFRTAARRPAFSVLDTSATRHALGLEGIHWRRQLRAMLQELQEHGED